MKLFETIVTYENSTEVYKRYDYFKTLKECKSYMNTFGMEIVRIKDVTENYISNEITENAKKNFTDRIFEINTMK